MKRFLALTLVFMLSVACIIPAAALSFNPNPYLRSVQTIHGTDASKGVHDVCTVFYVNSEKDYWMTAAHCVGTPPQGITASFLGSPLKIVAYDPALDIAVIYGDVEGVTPFRIGTDTPRMLDEVFVIGYPFDLKVQMVMKGTVANPEENLMGESTLRHAFFQISGGNGMSGSPVVDEYGKVISIIQIGFGQRESFSSVMGGATFVGVQKFREYFGGSSGSGKNTPAGSE